MTNRTDGVKPPVLPRERSVIRGICSESVAEDAKGRNGAEKDVADGPEGGPLAAEMAGGSGVGGGGGWGEVD